MNIGHEKKTAYCAKYLLCKASPFFKVAFHPRLGKSMKRPLEMPDDSVHTVPWMIHWLYTKKLPTSSMATVEEATSHYYRLATLHCIADKYDILDLRNATTDALFDALNSSNSHYPRKHTVKFVYENSNSNSCFRLLLAAWLVKNISIQSWFQPKEKEWLDDVPDLRVDLVMIYLPFWATGETPLSWPKSDLHEEVEKEL